MIELTHFSLFTGIGGIDLAAEWAGFETVGQVEKNEFCQKVLTKHWPDVPGWEDVKNVTKKSFRSRTGSVRPTIASGGEPCQPNSTSGTGDGKDDERYIWPEMLRVISEIKPVWVLNENVPGSDLQTGILDQKLLDLENEGYKAFPPIEADAGSIGNRQKRRRRIFLVAYLKSKRPQSNIKEYRLLEKAGCELGNRPSGCSVASTWWENSYRDLWSTEPDMVRVADGFPQRVDRIKSLGNAVVPQQVYPILRGIAEIERRMQE